MLRTDWVLPSRLTVYVTKGCHSRLRRMTINLFNLPERSWELNGYRMYTVGPNPIINVRTCLFQPLFALLFVIQAGLILVPRYSSLFRSIKYTALASFLAVATIALPCPLVAFLYS